VASFFYQLVSKRGIAQVTPRKPLPKGSSMGQRNRNHGKRQKPHLAAATPAAFRNPVAALERKIPVTYGKPFIVLEDGQKNTFVFAGGAWKPHTATIAECRVDCKVKELPQKINGMTRYEVCSPVPSTN
jgi:hypothetical protein